MGEPDPWGSIINPVWAAHLADVAEAWDEAAVTGTVPPSGEFPLSRQLYFSGALALSLPWRILRPAGNTHLTARGGKFLWILSNSRIFPCHRP